MTKFTDKQKRFIEEYPKDCCATKAAVRAGYSPRTANEQGAMLLAKVSIKGEIEKRLAAISGQCELDTAAVWQGYKMLLQADPRRMVDKNGQYKPLHELDDAEAFALTDFVDDNGKRKYKLVSKQQILDSIADVLDMFKSSKPVTIGNQTINMIQIRKAFERGEKVDIPCVTLNPDPDY
jgi:phage terminase small subunit